MSHPDDPLFKSCFVTKDSGERVQFPTGMQRDVAGGKARFDLMVPLGVPFEEQFLTRIAELYGRGAEKYAARNWERAETDEELQRFKESAFRHFMQWYTGQRDEDHAAAVFFNIQGAEFVKRKLDATPPAVAAPKYAPVPPRRDPCSGELPGGSKLDVCCMDGVCTKHSQQSNDYAKGSP